MQKIIRKTGIWVLVLALMVSFIPALPGVADEVNAEGNTPHIKLDFIKGNPKGNDFTWDGKVLQLNNMNRNESGVGEYDNMFIALPGGSTIILNGNNSIKFGSNQGGSFGIFAEDGDITIKGSGSLNLDVSGSPKGNVGIYVEDGDLIINSGTIVANANYFGIGTSEKLIINGGNVNAKATYIAGAVGDIQLNGGKLSSSGKFGLFGLSSKDSVANLTMTGGELKTQVTDKLYTSTPGISLPDEYQYKLSESASFTSYSKTKGGTPYTPTMDQKYLNITTTPPAPEKGTTFNSGKYSYKITDAKTNGAGTVAVTGFAKGKSTANVKIGKTVKYKGYTYKITAIAKRAFKGKKIKTVSIGNNVKTIGYAAFYKNKKLTKVTMGTGVTKIGNHAFCHDTKLKTIIIKSKKLKSVGKHVLLKNKDLKIKVPASKVKKYKKLFKNKGQKKSANVRVVKK